MEQLVEELQQIQQFVLLYPPQGEKGPNRVTTVLSKQTLTQQALAKTFGLDQLHIANVGNTGCRARLPHSTRFIALSPPPAANSRY
jgi:hypothetical protein